MDIQEFGQGADIMTLQLPKKVKLKAPGIPSRTTRPVFQHEGSLEKPVLERRPTAGEEVIDFSTVDEFKGRQDSEYISKITYFTDTNYKPPRKLPIPLRWSPYLVYKRILDHNSYGNYTGVTMIGMSGSGKTTLTQAFCHYIHRQEERGGIPYRVKWFNGHDMLNMDKHIKALEVGTPHVLIFDDASYTMEDASKSEKAVLANALTTIRHQVKAPVITWMNIHYSKATLKFFRNQHFTFLTSVSVEELGNLQDLFKEKMNVIKNYARQYNRMMLKGYFLCPISSFNDRTLMYKTNEPFRLGLVAEITDLHYFVYAKEECQTCRPTGPTKKLKAANREEVAAWLLNYSQPARTKAALEYFLTIKKGIPSLTPLLKSQIDHFVDLDRKIPGLPWNEIYNEFITQKKFNSKRHRNKQQLLQKLPIYQIEKMFQHELKDEKRMGKLPHNKLVKEPLLHEEYSPSETPSNEYMNTDPNAVPEKEKPKKLYDEYDSRFTESQ